MGREGTNWPAAIAGALEWWADAGVDTLVDERPRNWLAAPAAAPARVAVPAAVAAPDTMPGDLAAFEAWRVGPDAPEAASGGRRIAASGSAAAGLMILADMPDRGDTDTLLTGLAGRLFDRMLAAIGRDRTSVYLAPFCAARPVSGRIGADLERSLAVVALHHVALVAPRRVLLMGGCPVQALLGADLRTGRGALRMLNHPGGKTATVATFHPRFLLETPMAKAEAWKDLLMLIGADW